MIDKVMNTNANSPIVKKIEPVEGIPKIKEVAPENQDPLKQQQDTKEETEKIIHSMNDFLSASNSHLKFEFHDKLQEYYVQIVDDTTNEVIKELPPKKLLDMYAAMEEYLGLLVDKKG